MAAIGTLTVPPVFKPVASYYKLAADNDPIDPVIGYWCRLFVFQRAMKIDSKSAEARTFLIPLMDHLEQEKKALLGNEAVTNESVGQAHTENYACKIFETADNEDRAGSATIKTVKMYLAASQLFEVLSVFGEVSEEIKERQKYAKYRAAVIMKAVKSGERPPLPEGVDEPQLPTIPPSDFDTGNNMNDVKIDQPKDLNPPSIPDRPVSPSCSHPEPAQPTVNVTTNGQPLSPVKMEKAIKYCKYAGSALQYDDVPTAINNLEKALSLLKFGQE